MDEIIKKEIFDTLNSDITNIIKEIKEELKTLKIEGLNVEKEETILSQNTPDVNLPYNQEELERKLSELKKLQERLKEQNIYNQIKKSMNYLEEALEYEENIKEELKEYISICSLGLTELENGLSIMTDAMAKEVYKTIYRILKVQMSYGENTLFYKVKENENNKKYINELIREDIAFLIKAPFIKAQELVTLNKALARAEVNTDEEKRLVDIEVVDAIVNCFNSESRRTLASETITTKNENIKKIYEDSQSKTRGIENQVDNDDKVKTKMLKTESKRKIKLIAASISALITITTACGITINASKSEKLTISDYLETVIPISGLGATSALTFSAYKDKKTKEVLELEVSSIEKSIEELQETLKNNIHTGLRELDELNMLYDFMTSTSAYSSLTSEERQLLEETTSSTLKRDYFEYMKTNKRYL